MKCTVLDAQLHTHTRKKNPKMMKTGTGKPAMLYKMNKNSISSIQCCYQQFSQRVKEVFWNFSLNFQWISTLHLILVALQSGTLELSRFFIIIYSTLWEILVNQQFYLFSIRTKSIFPQKLFVFILKTIYLFTICYSLYSLSFPIDTKHCCFKIIWSKW